MMSCFILKAFDTFIKVRKYIVHEHGRFLFIFFSLWKFISVCLYNYACLMLVCLSVSLLYSKMSKYPFVMHPQSNRWQSDIDTTILLRSALLRYFCVRLSTVSILYLSYFKLIDWGDLQSVEIDLFFCC